MGTSRHRVPHPRRLQPGRVAGDDPALGGNGTRQPHRCRPVGGATAGIARRRAGQGGRVRRSRGGERHLVGADDRRLPRPAPAPGTHLGRSRVGPPRPRAVGPPGRVSRRAGQRRRRVRTLGLGRRLGVRRRGRQGRGGLCVRVRPADGGAGRALRPPACSAGTRRWTVATRHPEPGCPARRLACPHPQPSRDRPRRRAPRTRGPRQCRGPDPDARVRCLAGPLALRAMGRAGPCLGSAPPTERLAWR